MYPHFDIDNENMADEIKVLNGLDKIILLPNESFIRIENGKYEIICSYYESDSLKQKRY